ncbi:MAG: hydroxyethylthiazole kinase [Gammaproteobacteria bacterium]
MFGKIRNVVAKIKEEKPLILNITNDVTMDFIANGLLSLGASPVMSKAQQEMDDLLQLANSVVINLGTLDEKFIALCEYVCGVANQLKKPIILDPVGAGASHYRTNASLNIINSYGIAIIRGNASEIMSLSGVSMKTKGVDSTAQSDLALESAQRLSTHYDATVIVSGKTDIIVDVNNIRQLNFGSPLMPQITGTGCLLSAIVGAFHAVEKNRFDASVLATAFYGSCGEKASKSAQGPASFKIKFLDELNLIPKELSYERR